MSILNFPFSLFNFFPGYCFCSPQDFFQFVFGDPFARDYLDNPEQHLAWGHLHIRAKITRAFFSLLQHLFFHSKQ